MQPSRMTAMFLRPTVLLAAMLALGACGGGNEATDDAGAGVAAEATDAARDAEAAPDAGADTAEAPAVAEATSVPDWFPQDVPLPPAYSVVVARDMGTVQQVELRAEGDVAGLAAQLGDGLQAQGWAQTMQTGETTGYGKDARVATVTVNARDDGGTRVTYQFTTR